MRLFAVILAAGKGTRMKSKQHKVLHTVCGKPIIDHILTQLSSLDIQKKIVVVGYQEESLREHLGDTVSFVRQIEQLGTGHAVLQTHDLLGKEEGITLVLSGDHPLYTKETFISLVEGHIRSKAAATILTARFDDPTGYGRVIRQKDGSVDYIVEQKDASVAEQQVCEVNTGTYIFDNRKLFEALGQVGNQNAQGEYYLPDVISILKEQGETVSAKVMEDASEAMGVNDRVQLAEAEACMRQRILRHHMLRGVTVRDPLHTYVEADVEIGSDTVLEPGVILRGKTKIGQGCLIGPGVDLTDVVVADQVEIQYAVIRSSQVEKDATIGPYVCIRPNTTVEEQTKIGCFIDLKGARIGKGSKLTHLTYIGDTDMGEDVNVGCGTVTVNYNGKTKNKTTIEDGAFIGCNTNLVAPVNIGKGAYIAAGSTITEDVPENAFAIARERQTTKSNYASKLKTRF